MSDAIVLCYHAISERWPAALATTPRQLRQQVWHLLRANYRGATFSDIAFGAPAARAVAITFDDAYRSVIDLALPILAEAGFPATVFAPSAFIGRTEPVAWPGIDQWRETEYADELTPMSWDDLAALTRVGWEIGSHTRSHPNLTELNAQQLDEELSGSRADIEERLARPCTSLAYPYGYRDTRVIQAARRAGYTAAARTTRGRILPPSSALDWPRIMITRRDDKRRFHIKTSPAFRRVRASAAWAVIDRRRRRRRAAHPTVES